jgi:hypothetical protein
MLDHGNPGGKQQRVRGPFAVGGVVDVERVDTDQRCVMFGEPGRPARVRKCRPSA